MSTDHEYLINQLQQPSAPRIKLNFNHPVKELIWVVDQELLEKKFKREYLNFKLVKFSKLEVEMYNSIKTLDHVKKTPGMPLYYFYKKFNLN